MHGKNKAPSTEAVQTSEAPQDQRRSANGERLRYAQITNTLKAEIAGGVYPIGSMLPREAEICERFNVSRHTVREGLRGLIDLGLIVPRRGSGTRIVATTPRPAYVHSIESMSDILQYMRETRIDFETMQVALLASDEVEIVPAPEGSRWLKIKGVRRSIQTEEIMSVATVYVHNRFAPVLSDLRTQVGAIFPLLEQRTGELVAQVRQILSGASMPAEAAAVLAVAPGSPAIRILRRFVDVSGGPMLTSVNWHRADRFVYSITLQRGSLPSGSRFSGSIEPPGPEKP